MSLSALGGTLVACNSGSSNQPKVTVSFSQSICNLSMNESVTITMNRTNMPIESNIPFSLNATIYKKAAGTISSNLLYTGNTTESATMIIMGPIPCSQLLAESGIYSLDESSTVLPTSNTAMLTLTGTVTPPAPVAQ